MKTAEGKVDELIGNWITDAQTLAELECRMIQLLKEQDRDTRHACAEAVQCLPRVCETPTGDDAISPDDAHTACMNVKAV